MDEMKQKPEVEEKRTKNLSLNLSLWGQVVTLWTFHLIYVKGLPKENWWQVCLRKGKFSCKKCEKSQTSWGLALQTQEAYQYLKGKKKIARELRWPSSHSSVHERSAVPFSPGSTDPKDQTRDGTSKGQSQDPCCKAWVYRSYHGFTIGGVWLISGCKVSCWLGLVFTEECDLLDDRKQDKMSDFASVEGGVVLSLKCQNWQHTGNHKLRTLVNLVVGKLAVNIKWCPRGTLFSKFFQVLCGPW
jgi:hypothetical protein